MDPITALRDLVNACDKWLPEYYLKLLHPEYEQAVHALIHEHQSRRA